MKTHETSLLVSRDGREWGRYNTLKTLRLAGGHDNAQYIGINIRFFYTKEELTKTGKLEEEDLNRLHTKLNDYIAKLQECAKEAGLTIAETPQATELLVVDQHGFYTGDVTVYVNADGKPVLTATKLLNAKNICFQKLGLK
jgi:hypothetical protein